MDMVGHDDRRLQVVEHSMTIDDLLQSDGASIRAKNAATSRAESNEIRSVRILVVREKPSICALLHRIERNSAQSQIGRILFGVDSTWSTAFSRSSTAPAKAGAPSCAAQFSDSRCQHLLDPRGVGAFAVDADDRFRPRFPKQDPRSVIEIEFQAVLVFDGNGPREELRSS